MEPQKYFATSTHRIHSVLVADDLKPEADAAQFWRDTKQGIVMLGNAFTREGQRRKNGSLCMVGRMFEAAAQVMRW